MLVCRPNLKQYPEKQILLKVTMQRIILPNCVLVVYPEAANPVQESNTWKKNNQIIKQHAHVYAAHRTIIPAYSEKYAHIYPVYEQYVHYVLFAAQSFLPISVAILVSNVRSVYVLVKKLYIQLQCSLFGVQLMYECPFIAVLCFQFMKWTSACFLHL